MVAQAQSTGSGWILVQEYRDRERAAVDMSDYVSGAIRERAASNFVHATIATNVLAAIEQQLNGKQCRALSIGMKVGAEPGCFYVYPEGCVLCREPRLLDDEGDILLNPTVIFEVLSPSTEAYNRGLKAVPYRSIPSLKEHLLISQDRPLVERYSRLPDGLWLVETAEGLDAALTVASTECTLSLADVYDRIEFDLSQPHI